MKEVVQNSVKDALSQADHEGYLPKGRLASETMAHSLLSQLARRTELMDVFKACGIDYVEKITLENWVKDRRKYEGPGHQPEEVK